LPLFPQFAQLGCDHRLALYREGAWADAEAEDLASDLRRNGDSDCSNEVVRMRLMRARSYAGRATSQTVSRIRRKSELGAMHMVRYVFRKGRHFRFP
jgi:hypothetical protein